MWEGEQRCRLPTEHNASEDQELSETHPVYVVCPQVFHTSLLKNTGIERGHLNLANPGKQGGLQCAAMSTLKSIPTLLNRLPCMRTTAAVHSPGRLHSYCNGIPSGAPRQVHHPGTNSTPPRPGAGAGLSSGPACPVCMCVRVGVHAWSLVSASRGVHARKHRIARGCEGKNTGDE
eukprot:scaffold259370_cov23-Tisochrysis_lutea.AAC.2